MNHTPGFTPGPWAVEPLQWDHGASIAIVCEGDIIAAIPPLNEDDDPDEKTAERGPHDIANATLISAAPAMYEALKAVLDCVDLEKGTYGTALRKGYEMAGQALAQAEGRGER